MVYYGEDGWKNYSSERGPQIEDPDVAFQWANSR